MTLKGQRLVYKIARQFPVARSIRLWEKEFFNEVSYCPLKSSVQFEPSARDAIAKEARTLEKWAAQGIYAPRVLDVYDDKLAMTYIEGTPLIDKLAACPNLIHSFIETYQRIRDVACQSQDPDLLHSDNHFGNYLIDRKGHVAALDSANIFL